MVARYCMHLALVLGVLGVCSTHLVADEKKATGKERPEGRYAVPDGDAEQLLEFIESVLKFRPTTSDEFAERRQLGPPALEEAAKRILKIEQGKPSKAARTATELLLRFKVQNMNRVGRVEHAGIFAEIKDFLTAIDRLTRKEASLVFKFATGLEQLGNRELAGDACRTFGSLFAEQDDELIATHGQKLLAVARRLDLLGNPLEIAGKTVSGDPIEWESFRGRVVLIDFWATWCGPCRAGLPNVKKYYDQYHERGFEVIGISLDTNRHSVEKFLKEEEVPWVTLFEDGAGWDHPMATNYGVMGIPTLILVDRGGTVVSLNAHGPELGRQLAALLGPPDAAPR